MKSRTARRILVAASAVTCLGLVLASASSRGQHLTAPVTVPFDLVNRHIVVPVTVNGSRPLAFIFDTGNTEAILDASRARELNIPAGRELSVTGTGSGSLRAFFVSDARFALSAAPEISQPIAIAVPLDRLSPRLGHDVDGIFGTKFIEAFVVEVDYQRSRLVLHDASTFAYDGSGTVLPLRFDKSTHPVIDGAVAYQGARYAGSFVLDLGSSSALTLHTPFVKAHGIPELTVPLLGAGGAAGKTRGVAGRVSSLVLGPYAMPNPPAVFADDESGAFTRGGVLGTIGERAMARFRIYLDYRRSRVILEPASDVAAPFPIATCGCSVTAEGPGFHTFRIEAVADDWPAARSGVRPGDVIAAVDGRDTATLTLTELLAYFETPASRRLRIVRGGSTVEVSLTPRPIP